MIYGPHRHQRRSLRLPGYDYSQAGAYFVTLCTHDRACVFGEVVDGEMRLNEWGEIVRDEWFKTATVRPYVVLNADEFVIMPNHVHGIIWIVNDDMVGATGPVAPIEATRRVAPTERPCGPTPASIGAIMAQFKSAVTKRSHELRGTPGLPVWQRNYYEHVIRNEESLDQIREYIRNNPVEWASDRENPEVGGFPINLSPTRRMKG